MSSPLDLRTVSLFGPQSSRHKFRVDTEDTDRSPLRVFLNLSFVYFPFPLLLTDLELATSGHRNVYSLRVLLPLHFEWNV